MFAVNVWDCEKSHGIINPQQDGEFSRRETRVYVSVSDSEKREHICPLEEYGRRSTGEIVVKISQVISAGLGSLRRETGLCQLGLIT